MASSNVDYIYKIVPGSPPVPITVSRKLPQGYSLPVSDIDRKSGFLHMSTAAQIPNTLNCFFASAATSKDSVYLFKVPYQPLEQQNLIRWESPDGKVCGPRDGEGLFPHIHDGLKFRLTTDEVEVVTELMSDIGESGWDHALTKLGDEDWLV